jgi:hypothetical protein
MWNEKENRWELGEDEYEAEPPQPESDHKPFEISFTHNGVKYLSFDVGNPAIYAELAAIIGKPALDGYIAKAKLTEQLQTLAHQVLEGTPSVVAHLCDLVNALAGSLSVAAKAKFDNAITAVTNQLSQEDLQFVQIENEPRSTGLSQWRDMYNKVAQIAAELGEVK